MATFHIIVHATLATPCIHTVNFAAYAITGTFFASHGNTVASPKKLFR